MFTVYKKFVIYALFFISTISAMDTPETDAAAPQDLMLATLTKNISIFNAHIQLMNKTITHLKPHQNGYDTEGQAIGEHLQHLYTLQQQTSSYVTLNAKALRFHQNFLEKKAITDEKARLFKEDILKDQERIHKDMQERAEESKRRQEEVRQNRERVRDAVNAVGEFAGQAIQNAQDDIEYNIKPKLLEANKKLKIAKENRDDHNQKFPYIFGGIFMLIALSVYLSTYFMPNNA